jgi:hypothetical protein
VAAGEDIKEMQGCEAWGCERAHGTVYFSRHAVFLTLEPLRIWDIFVAAEICQGLRG